VSFDGTSSKWYVLCFLMSKITYVNGKKAQADTGQGTGGFII